jgi:hypothetical protein
MSHDCKLDLVTIQGNITGDQYIRDVLQPVVLPHFDNHPLATRPVYMDDNARPHRSRAVTAYLQIKVITKLPNSEQSYKGKVKNHNYINRQNQSTTGKL